MQVWCGGRLRRTEDDDDTDKNDYDYDDHKICAFEYYFLNT